MEYNEEEEMKDSEIDSIFAEPKLNEYIFVIDRSGSMNGQPMQLAKEALLLFLHSIPLGSKFNVVSFGTNFEKLFDTSKLYNQ
jgi:uncharacterized protein with von Willebrand factor type A (vWA) domain